MTAEPAAAARIVADLGLRPHPEGGHYIETYRHVAPGRRGLITAIYYLLQRGEVSRWHRVRDAVEIWAYHAGAALELMLSPDGRRRDVRRLGADLGGGERPQAVVPVDCWQSARSLGDWTLVSCLVAPAFEFSGFELAPPDWQPTLHKEEE